VIDHVAENSQAAGTQPAEIAEATVLGFRVATTWKGLGEVLECLPIRKAVRELMEECRMLVLTRKLNEEIIITGEIQIQVLEVCGNRVRLGITAPENISIQRREICFDAPDMGHSPPVEPQVQRPSRGTGRRRETALVG